MMKEKRGVGWVSGLSTADQWKSSDKDDGIR